MRLLSILLLLSVLILSCKDKPLEKPFPNLEFDKVIAYKMKGMDGKVIENNKLSNNVEEEYETLETIQIQKLLSIVNVKSTYGGVTAKCFEPHLGFVFYGNNDEIVAHTTICLACNWMSSTPSIEEFGFSKKGAKRISEFAKEIFNE